MSADQKPPSQKALDAAKKLEILILPAVQRVQQKELTTWPYESSSANEEILRAGIAFLRGENPHLSGFVPNMTYRWQGVSFVIWLTEILHDNVEGHHPAITAKEVLEWLKPFQVALLLHKDLPEGIGL